MEIMSGSDEKGGNISTNCLSLCSSEIEINLIQFFIIISVYVYVSLDSIGLFIRITQTINWQSVRNPMAFAKYGTESRCQLK